jgi:hypothetical protein
MDDLRSLWMTCSSMRRICGHLAIGQRLALDRFTSGRTGADPVNYYTLLASLEACFLIEIQLYSWESATPSYASTISPTPPMVGTI